MSGGSFNYFYSRAPDQLRTYAAELERMAEACAVRSKGPPEFHWKTRVEVDMGALLECGVYLRALAFRMQAMATLLEKWEDITHAVEWWTSGDSGIEDVVEAFKELHAAVPSLQVTDSKGGG